jgi:hypothetical protein
LITIIPVTSPKSDRLTSSRFEDVFVAEPGTEDAQREVYELIHTHLGDRFGADQHARRISR